MKTKQQVIQAIVQQQARSVPQIQKHVNKATSTIYQHLRNLKKEGIVLNPRRNTWYKLTQPQKTSETPCKQERLNN